MIEEQAKKRGIEITARAIKKAVDEGLIEEVPTGAEFGQGYYHVFRPKISPLAGTVNATEVHDIRIIRWGDPCGEIQIDQPLSGYNVTSRASQIRSFTLIRSQSG